MIKKINVKQLRIGMYINDLNCGWLDHPFSVNRFKIKSREEIQQIKDAGVKEVEVDTSKGIDVFIEKRKAENSDLRQAIDKQLIKHPHKISVQQELSSAQIAFTEAGELISQIMADVKMGLYIELEQVSPVVDKLSASILRNPNALLGLSRIRSMDRYTFEHSVSFSILLMLFAKSMGLSRELINDMGIGGLLHDIGKTLTPDAILNKPGKLTEEEFIIMKRHVVDSRLILEKTKGISQVSMDIAAQHHEKIDGSGYPHGLKGEQISVYGQMAAIVDIYDAITADRCYHSAKEPAEALKLLLKFTGTHLNHGLVHQFVQAVGIYPVGSLVLLSNQHLATVIDIHDNMLNPIVEVFLNTKTRSYIPREMVNLAEQDKVKIVSIESYRKWNIHN
jgi:putative nucleotidyltransferase with HDIG domain